MTTQPQSPSEQEIDRQAEQLAMLFHATYEKLAPNFGYKTREASAVPWLDVPKNNRELMLAVMRLEILPWHNEALAQAADKREQEILEAARAEDAKAAEEYRTSWLMRWTVYDEYIGRRLGRLNRQGKPAEGNK